ncbi:MAG: efflux RND transporter permease subunit [Myxococcota bacterium]
MQWLAEVCVRRPVFASVLVLTLVVLGFFGYSALGVDRFPKIDFPIVVVTTVLPGAAPAAVESEVSDPIEEALNTISGIDELRSSSAESVSIVVVQFNLEKNIDVAVAEVRDKLGVITRNLPKGIEPPVISRMDPDARPVLSISVSADAPIRDITEYANRTLRRRLEGLPGVGDVTLLGGQRRQINVTLDAARLRASGLTALDVARALQTQSVEFPGGAVDQGATQLTLRTMGKAQTVEDLANLVVANRGPLAIRIRDVANVEDAMQEQETEATINGKAAVLLSIRKQSGANTVQVVDVLLERIKQIEKSLPRGYKLGLLQDQSTYVRNAIHSVEEHLVVGSLLAALVVLLFLANFRSTLIAAIAIPTSVISTFALMAAMKFTLNVLTLLALTLSVGIVIDDAMVVLENIVRHIDEKKRRPYDAAVEATREIGLAVLATTLSLAIIFIPVAFMGGIVGRFMNSFGLTMAFSILVSMLVSFTLTPMMCARLLKPSKEGAHHNPISNFLERGYTALLRWCLHHRWVVGVLCVATVASLAPLGIAVNKNFLPMDDESQFGVFLRAPEGTTLRQTSSIAQKASRLITQQFPEVEEVLVTIGDDAGKTPNAATLFVKLVPVERRKLNQDEVMVAVREKALPALKEHNLRTSVGRFGIVGGGGAQNAVIAYQITGPDLSKLTAYADQIAEHLRNIPGTVDVDTNTINGKPELGLHVDRAKAADLGVNMTDLATTVNMMVGGQRVARFEDKGEQYDVFVRGAPGFRTDLSGISQLTVPSRKLGAVSLADVASFEGSTGPSVINRLNRRRQVTITSNLLPGYSQAGIVEQLQAKVATMGVDPAYEYGVTGQSKEQAKSGKAFIFAFLLSFIFMYLVLAAQFESWVHPITILLALPLTLPFALLSILILRESLNIFSMLGALVLFGVVKKNGILQIDHANQLKETGLNARDAVLQASRDRLRPILMTTVAFVAGMIPLAISTGTGAATNRATSSVIIGGQIFSLILTLVATPVAYTWFDDLQQFARRVMNRLTGKRGGSETTTTPPQEKLAA